MTRPIKFRAWSNKYLKMGEPFIPFLLDKKVGAVLFTEEELQNEIVLLQFTGLLDKNGKEIYEGDILLYLAKKNSKKGRKKDEKHYWEILWNEKGQWDMRRKEEKFTLQMRIGKRLSQGTEFEIIGNIYENPELLK